jgi:DNA repair exonuclease SbcCD ATPase subunit
MKSRTVSMESTRRTPPACELSEQIRNEIDQYIVETKTLHNRIKEIRKHQRHENLSNATVRAYWNEAIERKAHVTDERNRLRYIPLEFKDMKHSENGKLGHSELRELRNLQRFKRDIETNSNKAIRIRKDIQEQLQKDANVQAILKKKVKEEVAVKDANIKLADMELESLKKGKIAPANLTVNLDLTDLVDQMRKVFAKGKQKCIMTIEEGKIVKLE